MNLDYLKKKLPYFLQSKERKDYERKIAYRTIRKGCFQANYNPSICTHALADIISLKIGANPRTIIKDVSKQVRYSRDNPNYYSTNHLFWSNNSQSKEYRKNIIQKKLEEEI